MPRFTRESEEQSTVNTFERSAFNIVDHDFPKPAMPTRSKIIKTSKVKISKANEDLLDYVKMTWKSGDPFPGGPVIPG